MLLFVSVGTHLGWSATTKYGFAFFCILVIRQQFYFLTSVNIFWSVRIECHRKVVTCVCACVLWLCVLYLGLLHRGCVSLIFLQNMDSYPLADFFSKIAECARIEIAGESTHRAVGRYSAKATHTQTRGLGSGWLIEQKDRFIAANDG